MKKVKSWFFELGNKLLENSNSNNGFIVLMICMLCIEQYKAGIESNQRSKECFKDSLERIFPSKFSNTNIDNIYIKSRCDLFHNGMVKGGVIFNYEFEEAIRFEDNSETIKINPKLLLKFLETDFDNYIKELKSDNT